MTALGKILAIFVFLLSLFWFGLTAVLFNARTEWRKAAEEAEKVANANATAADEIRKANDSQLAAIKAQMEKLNKTILGLKLERDAALSNNLELTKTMGNGLDMASKKLPELLSLQATNKSSLERQELADSQTRTMSNKIDELAIQAQDSARKKNDAELAQFSTQKALELKSEQVRQLAEQQLGTTAAGAIDFRGDVVKVGGRGEIVVFNGGLNAGIKSGMTFNVTRATAPYFIGTVTVNISPDTLLSAGQFTPVAGQRLTGDYVPRVGDSILPAIK